MNTTNCMIKADKCPICDTNDVKLVTQISYKDILRGGYTQNICKCNMCDFVWVDNPFSEEQLKQWYENDSQYSDDFYFEIPALNSWNVVRWQYQFDFIQAVVNASGNFSVMEIGPATGYNLNQWKQCAKVFAVEPSERSCKALKEQYNIPFYNGVFQDYIKESNDKFELVICAHVLEHIVNPLDFIFSIRKCTKEFLYIEVPTFNFRQADGNRGVFVDEHVNYFTESTLTYLMEQCGFDLVKMNQDTIHDRAWGTPIMSLWKKRELSESGHEAGAIVKESLSVQRYFEIDNAKQKNVEDKFRSIDKNAKVALYNVGSHAAKKLFAEYPFESLNIVKVYDDDKRLFGKKLYNKEIERFDRAHILDNLVETIVICNSFSQEYIVRDLEKMGLKDSVYCLF